MKRLTAEPDKDVDKVKLRSAFHGEGAYEAFKRIASEFYKDHTYKFAALTLDGDPRPDSVEFTAEFWSMPSKAATQPPNAPLTLEELREMDGEPVWVVEINGCPPRWGLVYWCRKNKRDIVYVTINNGASICAETFMAAGGKIYRRKPEEGAAKGEGRPKCFYCDNGADRCLGMAPEDGDEPIERCKRCVFCESGYDAEESTP